MKDAVIGKHHESGAPLSGSSLLYLFVVFSAAVVGLMLSIPFQLNWKESLVSMFTAAALTFFVVFTIVEMRRIGGRGSEERELAREEFKKSMSLLCSIPLEIEKDLAITLNSLRETERAWRDYIAAKAAYVEAQGIAARLGHRERLGIIESHFATMALEEGDNSTAGQMSANALGIAQGLGRWSR